MSVPPVLTSTYVKGGDVGYARDGNPTWAAFEEAIGALEGGRALAFSSGMGAVSAVLGLVPLGAVVAAPMDAYTGTRFLMTDLEKKGRLRFAPVDVTDAGATLSALEDGGMLWIESPTNPMLRVADIAHLAQGAHERGATVVVDNTFATPLLQNPLELGADVVVHSATKYLSGHSDVLLGAVVTRDDGLYDEYYKARVLGGAIPGPMETFLALRGIRTLGVRLERQLANAMELATRLDADARVTKVRYPGLGNDPGHELAARQMRGFGAIVSFELPSVEASDALCEAIELIAHTTSLGGVETTLERRGTWEGEGLTPGSLIRMSVGCENVEDLWSDLSSALGPPSRP